jgi:excisionase family DNA binding protein|tara:strand:+ start:57 stop:350 length:294 start_codon:yes stop_codon:yes gene_type:complete
MAHLDGETYYACAHDDGGPMTFASRSPKEKTPLANGTVEYLSPEELRKRLGCPVSKNTMYTAIAKNQIPHVRLGRRILVREDALDRLLEAQAADTKP